MKKLTLIIGTILILFIIGGGIYLGITSDKVNPIEKLGKIFQEEEQEKPKGITIKEVISGDNK